MRPKYIATPDEFWELVEQYLTWVEENPYAKKDWVGKDGDQVTREQARVPTWMGFESYLARIDKIEKLDDYAFNREGRYSEFTGVVARAKKLFKGECLSAALAGVAKENLTARIHGITEKTEVEHSGEIKTITGMRVVDNGDNP